MKIGPYQLQNLLANRVKFHFFDLRPGELSRHPLLEGSRQVAPESVLEVIIAESIPKDGPIVLICETGEVSANVESMLEARAFLNVCAVDGGVASLAAAQS